SWAAGSAGWPADSSFPSSSSQSNGWRNSGGTSRGVFWFALSPVFMLPLAQFRIASTILPSSTLPEKTSSQREVRAGTSSVSALSSRSERKRSGSGGGASG